MNLSNLHRVLLALACCYSCGWLQFCARADRCSAYATPSPANLDDNPTTGAIARSTRQAQATVTQQAVLDEEAHASRR